MNRTLFLIGLTLTIAAGKRTSTLYGYVVDAIDYRPLAGASVKFYSITPGDSNTSAVTDSLGRYWFLVWPGPGEVFVARDSYVSERVTITVKADTGQQQDFKLQTHPLAMPVVATCTTKPYLGMDPHLRDSILGLADGVRTLEIKPSFAWVGRSVEYDSTAIQHNNQAILSALDAFRHRRGWLFRRPASLCLVQDNRPNRSYVLTSGGRSLFILKYYDMCACYAKASVIDRVRVRRLYLSDLIGNDYTEAPDSTHTFLVLELEGLFHDSGRWGTIIGQAAHRYWRL